jgi:hypothetical protein
MIKILKISTGEILISEIKEIQSQLGEPDCMLIKPFLIKKDFTLESWMGYFSSEDNFMIHSDKIVTICDPKSTILEKYESLTK